MQLTQTEYNTLYGKALKAFAGTQELSWRARVYKVNSGYSSSKAIRLFLFCFALSTWENTPGAHNYLTEKQMLSITSKTR